MRPLSLDRHSCFKDSIPYVPFANAPLDQLSILINSPDPLVQSAFGSGWGALNSLANAMSQNGATFIFNFTGTRINSCVS
ncbi:hypothetical protein BDZ97DRAFT_1075672 [Flammula alnicola]|nr:hypothetical protein BDZ97DRAFT_1075672 [Flammula alnicola]